MPARASPATTLMRSEPARVVICKVSVSRLSKPGSDDRAGGARVDRAARARGARARAARACGSKRARALRNWRRRRSDPPRARRRDQRGEAGDEAMRRALADSRPRRARGGRRRATSSQSGRFWSTSMPQKSVRPATALLTPPSLSTAATFANSSGCASRSQPVPSPPPASSSATARKTTARRRGSGERARSRNAMRWAMPSPLVSIAPRPQSSPSRTSPPAAGVPPAAARGHGVDVVEQDDRAGGVGFALAEPAAPAGAVSSLEARQEADAAARRDEQARLDAGGAQQAGEELGAGALVAGRIRRVDREIGRQSAGGWREGAARGRPPVRRWRPRWRAALPARRKSNGAEQGGESLPKGSDHKRRTPRMAWASRGVRGIRLQMRSKVSCRYRCRCRRASERRSRPPR